MKEKIAFVPIENHSRKSIQVEASGLPTNFDVANVARLSFGHPENLALPPMGKGKSALVSRRFCNSQFNGNG